MTDLLRSVGLSRYELNARLKPALLALLPALVVAVFWYPGAWSVVGSVVAAASACGLLYAIALLARNRGRAAERRLGREVGRDNTARLLTHADDTFLPETKERYHTYIRAHGRALSTRDEEGMEPELAFRRARSAVDWLLEHTRAGGNAVLLLDENVAYGFQRNLYGLKPFGIAVGAIAIIAHVLLLALTDHGVEHFWFGVATCVPLVAFLLGWMFLVTKGASRKPRLPMPSGCWRAAKQWPRRPAPNGQRPPRKRRITPRRSAPGARWPKKPDRAMTGVTR